MTNLDRLLPALRGLFSPALEKRAVEIQREKLTPLWHARQLASALLWPCFIWVLILQLEPIPEDQRQASGVPATTFRPGVIPETTCDDGANDVAESDQAVPVVDFVDEARAALSRLSRLFSGDDGGGPTAVPNAAATTTDGVGSVARSNQVAPGADFVAEARDIAGSQNTTGHQHMIAELVELKERMEQLEARLAVNSGSTVEVAVPVAAASSAASFGATDEYPNLLSARRYKGQFDDSIEGST